MNIRKNLQPGDLVQVNDVNLPRCLWSKAIVKQVNYDPDGRLKTVHLKTATDKITRDVRNMCLLDEADYLTGEVEDHRPGGRFGGSVNCVHNQLDQSHLFKRPPHVLGLIVQIIFV